MPTMYMIFCLIHLLFDYANAEPIKGHNVSPANFREFPFIASLGLKTSATLPRRFQFCTGTLIAKKHVLTAAHCLTGESKEQVDVIVGDIDLTTATIKYEVDTWITYEDWALKHNKTIRFKKNDLAIIKLTTTVYRIGIEPVIFSNVLGQRLERTRAVIAGWGLMNDGKLADVLQKASVTIMTHKQCEKNIKIVSNVPIVIPKNYLCSSANPYTLTDCGDSGGPVLNENNDLIGVIRSSCPKTNWGDFPIEYVYQYRVNIHMDISYYMDFIQDLAKITIRTY